jgi:CoA:oxalate CoA-transferase
MSGGTRNQWQTFCAVTGLLDYIDDERFQTGESRTEHYVELEPVLNRVMRGKTTDKWIEELTEIGIPCGPINNIKQSAEDPQILARNMITEVEQPGAGKVKMIDTPLKFSRTQGGIQGAAPELGQDTGFVLKKMLNMSDEEIVKLKNEGVI